MLAETSPHCLWGCPQGTERGAFIDRSIYALQNNRVSKFADWVAYRVTPATIGSGCPRNWRADPDLNPSNTLEPEDYSGANAQLGTDRGHQVPLASFCDSNEWSALNYLSNVTPQDSDLNQGPWAKIENKVRDAAHRYGEAYVYSGPLYEANTEQLPNADESHRIPSGYWKVIVSLDGNQPLSAAFIFPQNTGRNDNLCWYEHKIDWVEVRSGYNLFPRLSLRAQLSLESSWGNLGWQWCP